MFFFLIRGGCSCFVLKQKRTLPVVVFPEVRAKPYLQAAAITQVVQLNGPCSQLDPLCGSPHVAAKHWDSWPHRARREPPCVVVSVSGDCVCMSQWMPPHHHVGRCARISATMFPCTDLIHTLISQRINNV